MKNIVIIGGSKGIGSAILLQQLETNIVYNISRNAPEITHQPQTFSVDVLKEALPEIEAIDTLIYCLVLLIETYWI
jgi:NAD(P)-dependent dehydrogenase (short-subunit alcohol dehydrogenase family)